MKRVDSIDASAPTRYLQWRLRGLVVADGDEIADDLAADVSPFIEYFLGGRPVRISDLAGTENTPASPASFDILDAFEQLGGFGARVTRVPAICGHQLLGVSLTWPIGGGVSDFGSSK